MLLWLAGVATAATLAVDPSDPSKYATIGDAITAASTGDTIDVAAGTYAECLSTGGKSLALVGVSGSTTLSSTACGVYGTNALVKITGGESVSFTGFTFGGTSRAFYVSGSSLALDDVTISGISVTSSTQSAGVYVESGTLDVSGSTISNLTGGGGAAIYALSSDVTIDASAFSNVWSAYYAGYGGAIFFRVDAGDRSLAIANSTFEKGGIKSSSTDGGVIYAWDNDTSDTHETSVTITDSTFTSNSVSGDSSGGVLVTESIDDVTLTDDAFTSNKAVWYGGALLLGAPDSLVATGNLFCGNRTSGDSGGAVDSAGAASETWERNVFEENQANAYGGALLLNRSKAASVLNNTFVGNSTAKLGYGAALYAWGSSTVDFRNNIVADSTAGYGVDIGDATTLASGTWEYDDFYGNTPGDEYGSYTFSTSSGGNLTSDPMFVAYSADGDCTNDDLTLASGSPAIDAGDPSTLDEDGTVADMGAYGGGVTIDDDGDGYDSSKDCDDSDATVYPGAPDVWYDGVDSDCAGNDDDDADADGYDLGVDCDDTNASVYPGAADVWYDGVDSDCAGNDDQDADADGYDVGVDCDDGDATVHPGAADAWYDGIDSDCAGNDDADADADGFDLSLDCDDTDSTVYPGAPDAWYDGVDSDCADDDDFDADGDGFDASVDCDDADATVYPGAADAWYDGVDSDCAGNDDADADADGSDAPDDCDDTDATIYPGAPDVWYDGVDSDCAGNDDFDADADGAEASADCDDADANVYPGAPDDWYDGVDSDCAGDDDFDADLDGFDSPDDCDDGDATVHPGADDVADDGVDQDCDGVDTVTPAPPAAKGCACDGRGASPSWAWILVVAAFGPLYRRRRAGDTSRR